MNYTIIKEQKTFTTLYRRAKPFHSEIITLLFMPCDFTQSAFVVSRKVGNAVCRNLVKRRLRALFYDYSKQLPKASYLWIAKPQIVNSGFSTIALEMERLGELAIKTPNKGKRCSTN